MVTGQNSMGRGLKINVRIMGWLSVKDFKCLIVSEMRWSVLYPHMNCYLFVNNLNGFVKILNEFLGEVAVNLYHI